MLLFKPEIIDRILAATDPLEIQEYLIGAFTLELATIPTYLTGAFSIFPSYNSEALALVQSVAYEEMLHMTLACNLLISIGGNPGILKAGQDLKFPTKLPFNVDETLTIELRSISKQQLFDVYMGIERPDTTAILPGESAVHPLQQLKEQQGYNSIGDFYDAILQKLAELQPFSNPRPEHQVDIRQWFPPIPELAETGGIVVDIASARKAVDVIIAQGEGAKVGVDPINPKGGLENSYAHYFKFGEIFYGKLLIEDKDSPSGWSYSGDPVPLDTKYVYNFLPNAAVSDYPLGSAARISGQAFYECYLRLLTALDEVFNGKPQNLGASIGIMYELKLLAQKVTAHPADPSKADGVVAAPPFMLGNV